MHFLVAGIALFALASVWPGAPARKSVEIRRSEIEQAISDYQARVKQTLCLSLPSVTMGAMPAMSGGRSAKLDAEAQAKAEADQTSGPYKMAHHLIYDDIIDPSELRDRILDGLATLRAR